MADTQVIETHEDEAPESQEHVQAMIDKAERVQRVPREDGITTPPKNNFLFLTSL